MLVSSSSNHHHQYRGGCGFGAVVAAAASSSSGCCSPTSGGGLHAASHVYYVPSCSISPPQSSRYIVPYRTPKIVCRTRSSSSASTVGTNVGSSSSMVAIDSKIEQAMDLVKTHLMFAVREEVEVLRGRIVDLENTVCNLEAENAVLRQHVSDEILRNMNQ